VQSLRYYLEGLEKKGLLTAEPLGWNNIERFLKMGPCSMEGQKGCFAVSSMREFAILPPEAVGIITRSRSKLKQLIAKNIEVERPKMNADSLAELVLTFFTGLSMEHNLSSSRSSIVRKIDDLMNIARKLRLTIAGRSLGPVWQAGATRSVDTLSARPPAARISVRSVLASVALRS
jgi:TetR/AcrR family transcriptional regulator, copper-responsive repressor